MMSTIFRQKQKAAFTLIATILVVSLITVIVVFALVVAQIEESVAYNSSQEEVARQNALFALNEAVNQLQISAGPDCRTTARSDIINGNSSPTPSQCGYSANAPATDSGQSYWTGVWKTTANDYAGCAGNGLVVNPDPAPGSPHGPGPGGSFLYYDYLPDGTANPNAASTAPLSALNPCPSRLQINSLANVTWLVSWPHPSSPSNQPDPTKSLSSQFPDTSLVVVANNINTTTSANSGLAGITTTSITVPKVPIMAAKPGTGVQSQVGSFAYWVSDEGIKAKVNIPDPFLAQSPPSPAHFQMAQAPNGAAVLNILAGLSGTSFNSGAASEIRTSSVIAPTLASLSYADSAGSWSDFQTNAAAQYSADFTVESLGVLADNFNGGLRKDLTAALENQNIWFSNFGDLAAGGGNTAAEEQARKVYSLDAITNQGMNLIPGANRNSTPGTFVMDGLRWDSLFYYYNLYKTNMPSPINVGGTFTPGPTGIGSQTQTASITPTIQDRIYVEPNPQSGSLLYMDPVLPLLMEIGYSTYVAVNLLPSSPNPPATSRAAGGPPNNYDLLFYVQPHMVMYNPYNVLLAEQTHPYHGWTTGTIGFSCNPVWGSNAVGYVGGSWCDVGTFQIIPDPSNAAANPSTSSASTVWGAPILSTGIDTPINPGELRVYGPGQTSVGKVDNTWAYPGQAFQQSLVSSPNPFANYAGEEVTLTSVPDPTYGFYNISQSNPNKQFFQGYPDDILVMVSASHFGDSALDWPGQQIAWNNGGAATSGLDQSNRNPLIDLNNFSTWPATDMGTVAQQINLSGYFISPGIGFHDYFSSCTNPNVQLGFLKNFTYAPTDTPKLDSVPLISIFRDGLDGYSTTSTTNETVTGTTTPYSLSLPLFASSQFFNPFHMGSDVGFRDFFSTCDTYATLPPSDMTPANTFANPVGNLDTTWLPEPIGVSGNSTTPFCLKEVPRGPLISLGQFKNMNCQYWSGAVGQCQDSYSQLAFSIYPVGGSYQENLPCNYTYLVYPTGINPTNIDNWPENTYYNQYLDDNFLGNEALFDGYFLSTVPPSSFVSGSDASNWPVNVTSFNQATYIDRNLPLPNSRLIYYSRNSSNPSARTPPTTGTIYPSIADLQLAKSTNIRKPAANLLINGAFNINSTSLPAWEALLSSTNSVTASNTLKTYQSGSSSLLSFSAAEVPFLNFSTVATPFSTPTSNQPWFGVVKCKTSDIATLAKQIVYQVQLRGPFLSLGDFLNRRLAAPGTVSTIANSGAIQSAIDSTTINEAVMAAAGGTAPYTNYANAIKSTPLVGRDVSFIYPPSSNPPPAPTGPHASAMGIPGTLMQQDVVQAIAPVIAARSDTFTIRAYGEAVNPGTGRIDGKAWCVAVVQRVPEYLYSTENSAPSNGNCAYDDPSQSTANSISGTTGLSTINAALGRRFKIVSFHWLNANEL